MDDGSVWGGTVSELFASFQLFALVEHWRNKEKVMDMISFRQLLDYD